MQRIVSILIGTALLPLALLAQAPPQPQPQAPPPDPNAYAVTYVDISPTGRSAAIAAFKQYREASRKEQGLIRLDVFEQVGRPSHFVVLERWSDASAMQAHAMAAHTGQLRDALQPIRLSGYDQRPYKTLSMTPMPAAPSGQAMVAVSHVDFVPTAGGNPPAMLREFAEVSRKDEGNLRFDVMQHTMRANHFTIVEVWRDQRAADAHAAATHTKQFREITMPMTGSPIDERILKFVE